MGVQKITGGGGKVGQLILANGVRLLTGSGAPTDGTTGTGAGKAVPGSLYFNYTNGQHWQNIGTKASPLWVSFGVHTVTVSLTNAEIKALRATPKLLVAAPGAGKLADLIAADLILDAGTNALTESADNLDLRYVGKSSGVLATVETTGFIDQTTDQMIRARVANDKLITKANSENLGVELFNNGDGELAGNAANDATLRVKVYYVVLTTGW